MIVSGQKNLKVHFAGLENLDFARILVECSKINYTLFTAFPYVSEKLGIKCMRMKTCTLDSIDYHNTEAMHSIMDSGIYSLCFGSHKDLRKDEKLFDKWYDGLVSLVHETGYRGSVVEVDCQKVLGREKAWEYRERIKKDLPDNRIINVFHLEDKQDGLDRMIEFSEYIAVSVPELRFNNKKNHVYNISRYIKNKKPSIDIHLLGCTENKILKELSFCSSSDSTSWQQVNRFGSLGFNHGGKTHRVRNSDIKSNKLIEVHGDQISSILNSLGIEPTAKRLDYYSKYALAGDVLKKQYSVYAGNQD
jgi:hypothetical protein